MASTPHEIEAQLRHSYGVGLIDAFEAVAVTVIAKQRPGLSYNTYLREARKVLDLKPVGEAHQLRAIIRHINKLVFAAEARARRDRKKLEGKPKAPG